MEHPEKMSSERDLLDDGDIWHNTYSHVQLFYKSVPANLGRDSYRTACDMSAVRYESWTTEERVGGSCCSRWWRRMFPQGYLQELRALLRLAWPMFMSTFCMNSIPFTSILFCGQLGKIELDAVSLANTIINVTGLSIGIGLTTACDTLFSQAFGGTNKKQVGAYLQKAILILLLALFPCWAIHLNTESLLLLVGQHPQVARLAGEYLLYYMPALIFNFMFQALSKYIQNQNIVIPSVIIGLVANGINILLHFAFVTKLQLGTNGSAMAQVVSNIGLFVFTFAYIRISKVHEDTWGGWSEHCLMDWGSFMKLAVPGMLMVCLEWWCFEVGTILSGVLNEVELGAQSIIFQLEALSFMIPMGISIAVSIRVGQFLGAGNAEAAKASSRVSLTIIWMTAILVSVLFVTLRNLIPLAFTRDVEVIDRAASVLPILAFFTVFDGIAATCGGVLRGCGRQKIGAVVIFIGYYILALPLGIPLMLHTSLKIEGLWLGYAVGIFLEACAFFVLVATTNWALEAEIAQMRACMSTTNDEHFANSKHGAGEESDEINETTALLIRRESKLLTRRYSSSALITAIHGNRFSLTDSPECTVHYLMPPKNRRYSSKYTPTIQQVARLQAGVAHAEALAASARRKLICSRIFILFFMIGILMAGICLRVFVPFSSTWREIPCIAANSTYNSNISAPLPLCNVSITI